MTTMPRDARDALLARKSVIAVLPANDQSLTNTSLDEITRLRGGRITQGKALVVVTVGARAPKVLTSLLSEHFNKFATPLSHTSRDLREGETEGVDYYFVPPPEYVRMEQANEFIESTEVGKNSYGTAAATVQLLLSAGLVPLLEVDCAGADAISASSLSDALFVLIKPSSKEVMSAAFDELKVLEPALQNAANCAKLMADADAEFDASSDCQAFDHTITDDDPKKALRELRSLVSRNCFRAELKG